MKSFISTLTAQTQTLKEEYVTKSIEWAAKEYTIIVERAAWSQGQWCEFLGIKPMVIDHTEGKMLRYSSYAQGSEIFPNGFYNTSAAKTYHNASTLASKVARLTQEAYQNIAAKKAADHYTNSIEKLAARIVKKGMNPDTLRVVTARVGVNIESTFTDGDKKVCAWTIVASGPVQKPHYRYLIK